MKSLRWLILEDCLLFKINPWWISLKKKKIALMYLSDLKIIKYLIDGLDKYILKKTKLKAF